MVIAGICYIKLGLYENAVDGHDTALIRMHNWEDDLMTSGAFINFFCNKFTMLIYLLSVVWYSNRENKEKH